MEVSIYLFSGMKILFLNLIVMLAGLPGAPCFAQTNAESFYYAGLSAFGVRDYNAALTNFAKSVELNPRIPMTYNWSGRSKWWLKDYSGAIADYDKAIALDPKCGGYYSNHGQAKYALNMMSEALEDFDKAIELDPKNAQAYFNRGTFKLNYLTNYAGATADYTKAIEIHDDPEEEDIYFCRGNARMELKDYAGAIADYRKVLELNPKHVGFQTAMTNIANAQRFLSEWKKK